MTLIVLSQSLKPSRERRILLSPGGVLNVPGAEPITVPLNSTVTSSNCTSNLFSPITTVLSFVNRTYGMLTGSCAKSCMPHATVISTRSGFGGGGIICFLLKLSATLTEASSSSSLIISVSSVWLPSVNRVVLLTLTVSATKDPPCTASRIL